MLTALLYLSILLLSTFFVYISEKGKGRLEHFTFLFIAFLIVFIPSAIRYDIGTDFLSYLNIYNNLDLYTNIEPGYYLLNWILNQLGAPSQWIYVVTSFIFTYAIFKAYPQSRAWVIHFAAFSLLLFFSFNGTRQALAIAFCLIAVFKFFKKEYVKFVVLILIGSSFHTSALVILLCGLLALIPLRYSLKARTLPIVFIIAIALTFVSVNLVVRYIEQILTLLRLTQYSGYFTSGYFNAVDSGSGLAALVKILFSVYIITQTRPFLKMNPQYWFLILLTFFYTISVILATNIVIFGRMQMVFIISPILGLYFLPLLPQRNQFNKVVSLLFITFLLLLFIKDSLNTYSGFGPDPKLNPYKSIFYK